MVYFQWMLIDDVTIKVSAGKGGTGKVAFNKNLMSLGPAGGSGGKGGSVFFEGVSDLSTLNQFRFKKEVKAENGKDGKMQFADGNDAEDIYIKVPVGTVIHFLDEPEIQESARGNIRLGQERPGTRFARAVPGSGGKRPDREIVKIGERVLVARGGKGGRGNFHFRSSTNTTPKQFEFGRAGDEFIVRLELKYIADVGFIGYPNVGKSSLLNELTRANSKVANYPFTTLEPNLGVYYDLILADLPGLIEGASGGKGLGIKFLRHAERTKFLFHFVAADSASPEKDYKIIRKELGKFSKELLKKKEYLFLSKHDLVPPAELKKKLTKLKKLNKNVLPISVYDWDSLESVKKILNRIADEKRAA